jgi:N-formylglutamate deformylase
MIKTHVIKPALKNELPIIISCPHVGTEIPDDIKTIMMDGIAQETEDTDWFVHELYSFAPKMGITLIKANYSRFVIDLNRDPSGKSLYKDARRQTAIVPLTTFEGKQIYRSGSVTAEEVERRQKMYFDPYHAAINDEVKRLKSQFSHVLFFDAHSIKRSVKSIRSEPFPDVIVGDNDGATAHPKLTASAIASLKKGGLEIAHNDPFKGGFLTRSQGRPQEAIHALQLEMSQDLYMNEDDNSRNSEKEKKVSSILMYMFQELNAELENLR